MQLVGHICNNYPSSSVHRSLAQALLQVGVESDFFIPTRCVADADKNSVPNGSGISLFHVLIPNWWLKYFPLLKIIIVSLSIISIYNNKSRKPKYFIAHTFWSDGMVCLFLKLVLGIDYVVCVRNTDVNLFFKYLFFYRFFQRLVSRQSRAVVFISPALKELSESRYSFIFKGSEEKIYVIPNGVGPEFLDDMRLCSALSAPGGDIKCCYVGKLDDNKNLIGIVRAINKIRLDGVNVCINFVGFSRQQFIDKYSSAPSWATFNSYTNNIQFLKEVYRGSHVFLMPSFYETFGLVYIEAITQGCSCVCSRDQGVSGLFEEFGLVVQTNPHDSDDIARAILLAYEKHSKRSYSVSDLEDYLFYNFRWRSIAARYMAIFELSFDKK